MGEAVPQTRLTDADLNEQLFGSITLEMLCETFEQRTIGRASGPR